MCQEALCHEAYKQDADTMRRARRVENSVQSAETRRPPRLSLNKTYFAIST